jgi:hypothetical protein
MDEKHKRDEELFRGMQRWSRLLNGRSRITEPTITKEQWQKNMEKIRDEIISRRKQ